ncbi:conserved hypothetical protein [Culex quinquefasciatus]|uniref:Ionotropic glutamate receptor C-terminal domain-containing protein n=1 Tax=Culex quinquefasciatus TaxID=7176 RepID=B0X0U2_CULQU|nr:conserved hypothetical protein [Culex quinquefasciatus]|eukprot:XP_001863264.1 conserved hypothetical protein [Culex quinquefasciatus]
MNGALRLLSNSTCSRRIIDDLYREPQRLFTGVHYLVVFFDTSRTNIKHLEYFVKYHKLCHGNNRYIFVVACKAGYFWPRGILMKRDRFRMHNVMLIRYDEKDAPKATFWHPFLFQEYGYVLGQNVEQAFRSHYTNMNNYPFLVQYLRLDFPGLHEIDFYRYFFRTVAELRNGGEAVIDLYNNALNDYADFWIMDAVYFGIPDYFRLLPMNVFRYLCLVTPSSSEIPWIRIIIDPYEEHVWIAFIVVFELVALVLYQVGRKNRTQRDLITAHFEAYQMFMEGPLNRQRSRPEKIVVTTFVFFSMILITIYESVLVSSMSVKRFYPELNTIEEVNNSAYPVAINRKMAERNGIHFKQMLDWGELVKGNIYTITTTCEAVDYFRTSSKVKMHVVKEYLSTQIDSFLIATFSPYDAMISQYWSVFLESELISFWMMYHFPPKYFGRENENVPKPLLLHDMNISWVVALIGLSTSLGVFLIEMSAGFFKRRKKVSKMYGFQDTDKIL